MPLLDGFTPWPEPAAARYRAEGYWTGTTLGSVLRDGARRTPGHTALVTDGRRLTYAELDEAADRVAAGLRAHGLKAGNRLLVHLPNGLPFVLTLFGCFRAAVVPVLALPAHRESELVHLARLSGAAACVMAGGDPEQERLARTVSTAAHTVRHVFTVAPGPYRPFDALTSAEPDPGAPDDARPQDVAVLLLSGGTTGLPKLIPRTHDDYAYNLRASARVTGLDDSTVTLLALPAAHNFALACPGLLGTLHAGGTTVLAPSPDPETAFDLIARERVTTVALVPPLVLAWLDAAELLAPDLTSLTLLQAGGARLKEEAARRVRPVLGCALQQVYGMAEGLLNFTRLDDPDETVFTSQGRPLSDADEVRVVGPDGPDGADVPDGETGELWTRGPYTLRGYFRAEQHNATAFTPDGFYRSGDLVRRLPGGNLVVEGRLKDVINRGGDKVPVEEVENHLLAHPHVHDVALVGFPDPDMGERTCAFVVPRGEAPTRRDLVDHLVGRGVAAFKHPDRVRTVDRFPRTGAGKVDRVALTRTLNTVAEAL
ncbi:2,3-dihydroxybenzoate-AMP ligase [Streptomyces sp. enrichment culture]|uniref:(2,3-dihydroxybenzoyl)adenylate synthase n=1 Tax=Streptomyces sp. enrichment culture TaxID=1795815 RepID=UPI003F54E8BA